ncbi:chitosanase [Limnohabitans sp.]|uniref:VgrG-related protein n=1 Tax=Limnohabitans sp. TaxID=1907725 RepID=UPI00286F66EA|nr:hypothetical protein [Limnohabitans sp.]
MQDFLKGSKYGDQFKGLEAGTDAFNAKWKEVAKNDPEFEAAQHDYIKRTNFDPAVANLKRGGIDLSGRGAAVQDAMWSTSVQFGGGNEIFQKALKGKDHSQMSDAEIVEAVQDYKIKNNDSLFAKSSDAVRAGTAKRAKDEKSLLLAKANEPITATDSTNVAAVSVSTAAPPKIEPPSTPPIRIPEAPEQTYSQSYSNSNQADSKQASVVVNTGKQMAGRDLSSRPIAHIVTGGLSGSYL